MKAMAAVTPPVMPAQLTYSLQWLVESAVQVGGAAAPSQPGAAWELMSGNCRCSLRHAQPAATSFGMWARSVHLCPSVCDVKVQRSLPVLGC